MQIVAMLLGGFVAAVVGSLGLSAGSRIRWQRRMQEQELNLLREQLHTASIQRRRAEQSHLNWNGVRKFRVKAKVRECHDTYSFLLTPHDRKALPEFRAGQFLTVRLDVPGQTRPVIRCYSISNAPDPKSYRITVRRVPDGVASPFLHDDVEEGQLLDIQAPRGDFWLDPVRQNPAVLIAGGIGITPLVSMIDAIADSQSGREVHLFYSVRHPNDLIMLQDMRAQAERHENIRVYIGASTKQKLAEGPELNFSGRINVELLSSVLPSNNFDFFICGPPSMMATMVPDLVAWGVPKNRVHTEAFGADSVRVIGATNMPKADETTAAIPVSASVRFSRSDKSGQWTSGTHDLLEFAESMDVPIPSGCRAGSCGSCVTAIRSGKVRYLEPPSYPCDDGTCLPCIAVPADAVELDA